MLGELLPKQIGLRNAERAAVIVARPMQLLAMAASSVVSLLDGSARLGLRLLGQSRPQDTGVTDQEIMTMIDEAEQSGLVEPEERSMISRVMRLGDRSVRAIMTPRPDVEWIDLNDGEDEIRDAIRKARHGRMLVANGASTRSSARSPVRAALVALMDEGVSAIWVLVEKVSAVSDQLGAIDVVEQLRPSRRSTS